MLRVASWREHSGLRVSRAPLSPRSLLCRKRAKKSGPAGSGAPHSGAAFAPTPRPGRLTEQFGPFVILLRIAAHEEGFDLTIVGWRLGPLPLPAILAPRSKAHAFVDDDGCYRFDVAVTLPFIGTLVHYRGWLVAEP
ncbi:DUF4166 domain-containing protein [Microvirga brassicacearum]|uniref:DUF4166 domain-containing protein n=1 Tax=Microvirga brassicacearum TaxID=2580413 RepID=UPI0023BA1649|nr:DUF4166 domain-containing protein [Microvirga brassicacearum]